MKAAAWCLVFAVAPVAATAQVQQASLAGTVIDSSRLPVPGATVEIRDLETNHGRVTATDRDGRFVVVNLAPGRYALRITLAGFTAFEQRDLTLSVAQPARVDVTLEPAGLTETVTVSGTPRGIDPERTSVAMVVDTERIEELPVRSRNYLEFVVLAPGVVRSSTGVPSSTAAAPWADSGFSFAGLRPRSNSLTIDGLDNNDEFSGGSRTELSLEIVREFQVVTSGWSAESGGASGGAINVVTKSGANTLHGDAFLFAQSGRLNASPKLEDTLSTRPRLTRFRGGLALGGPIVANRTFYYTAGEQEEMRGQAASNTSSADAASINAFLAAGGVAAVPTRQLRAGFFPTGVSETELSARLTHRLTNAHALTGRMAATNRRAAGEPLGGLLSDASARGGTGLRDIAATATWSASGHRFTNDVRLQAATRRVALTASDPIGPGVLIPGVIAFGRPYLLSSQINQRYAQVGDTFAIATGRHLWKAGVDALHVGVTAAHPGGGGLLIYPTLGAFFAGAPDSVRHTFTAATSRLQTLKVGAFAQDHWAAASTLTLDAGVRLEVQTVGPALGVSNWQVAPRGGVAWAMSPRWVMRGGAGLFTDRLPLAMFERAIALNGSRGFEQIGATRSIYTARAGNWTSSSGQANLGVERELTSDMTAAVSYLMVRGRHLPRTINVNNTGVFEVQPSAWSRYRGVTTAINRRLANELEWSASYTWSTARDTASDFDEQPHNTLAPDGEAGPSRHDQRHRFVVNALFDVPIGEEEDRQPGEVFPWWIRALSNIEMAPIVTVGSGRPVNPLVGADTSGAHAYDLTARPPGFGRNSLRLPSTATVDLRVLKFFPIRPHGKLDLVVEAFNLLNRTNVTAVNNIYGSDALPAAGFMRAIAAANARQLQFSIDFEF